MENSCILAFRMLEESRVLVPPKYSDQIYHTLLLIPLLPWTLPSVPHLYIFVNCMSPYSRVCLLPCPPPPHPTPTPIPFKRMCSGSAVRPITRSSCCPSLCPPYLVYNLILYNKIHPELTVDVVVPCSHAA
jgi:hypothetical protein